MKTNKLSIKAAISTIAGIAVIIVIIYMSYLSHKEFVKTSVSQTQNQLLATLRVISAEGLKEFIIHHQESLLILSNDPLIKERTYNKTQWNKEEYGEKFCQVENLYKAHNKHVSALTIIDADGKLLDRDPFWKDGKSRIGWDHSDKPGVACALQSHKPCVSEVFYNNLGNLAVSISEPVFYKDEFTGIVRWMIEINTISKQFIEPVKIGKNGFIWMFDNTNTVLSHPRKDFIGLALLDVIKKMHGERGEAFDESIAKKHIIESHDYLNRIGDEVEGAGIYARCVTDERDIIAYKRFAAGNLILNLIASLPYSEITGPINKHARETFGLAGFVIMLLGAGGLALFKSQKEKARLETEARYLKQISDGAEALRKTEVQLQRSLKIEAIATLAGGVAHEFNNALVGISGNIELLQMHLPDDKNMGRYVQPMKDSAHRMAGLTNQLLAYARGGKYQPKILSLNDFVEDTLPVIQHNIAPGIRVETDLAGDISNIEVDLTQMQMMFSAVLTNAAESMEESGRIRIITRNEEIDEEFAKTNLDVRPGPYVCLTIEDEGKGMGKETIRRVFDPFFTTKFQGRGLGMAAAYGIIRSHGGSILIRSELGKGTEVRIYLPVVEVREEEAKETKTEVAIGNKTILVIEDEDVVMDVIRLMLEGFGCHVLPAKTGSEAVEIARTFEGDIDLAILDIVLPDMGGENLYPLIMEALPNLKVIVCSGYAIDGPAQKILDAGAQDFIQKPFSLDTLLEKLKKTINDA
ncbi:MAG: response regulator [Desulfobacterales bacterium]|nr:response regulator [Desulfobacterales bacterium]